MARCDAPAASSRAVATSSRPVLCALRFLKLDGVLVVVLHHGGCQTGSQQERAVRVARQ